MAVEDTIENLIETLEDGREGFARAADRLEDDGNTELAEEFRSYAEQRAEMLGELRAHADEHDVVVEEDGSIIGALHRGWITLKDALTGDDPRAIATAAASGENHAVEQYEQALDDEQVDAELRTLLEKHLGTIRSTRNKVVAAAS